MNKTIHFEDAIKLSSDQAWGYADKYSSVTVICDDGQLTCPPEDFFINTICWEMFKVLDKDFPSSIKYTISTIEHMSTRTHLDICSAILKDYVFFKEARGIFPDIEKIKLAIYDLSDRLDNEIDNRMNDQISDICFDHLLEIYEDPEVAKANHFVQTASSITHDDIQEVYKKIHYAVMIDPKYSENALCISARCGVIKLTQLYMVLGPIGYCTDINSKIIPHVIRVGFFRGMAKFDDMVYESRNSSIAALFNIIIMPLAEYGNRCTQLPAENLKQIIHGDCGAKAEYQRVNSKAQLMSMRGFRLMSAERGEFIKYIDENDTDLIGKSVFVRTLNYCRHKYRNAVCSTCVGLMHYSFPTNCVIGHVAGTQLGSRISTAVLQRKHQNLTSQAAKIILDEIYRPYIEVNNEDHGYFFAKDFDYTKWDLVLSQAAASQLKEINSEYGHDYVASQMTRIEILELRSKDGLESISMPIGYGQRAGFLSKQMLNYVKRKGWTFSSGEIYQIDLSEWRNKHDFLTVPQIEFTPPDLIEMVTEFMFSGTKDELKKTVKTPLLSECRNVSDAYQTFYEVVKDHLKGIHSVHLRLLILAMSVQDADNYDYRLPYPRENARTAKLDDIMRFRSLGGALAYEEQNRLLLNPLTYLIDRRPSHIYDSILMG